MDSALPSTSSDGSSAPSSSSSLFSVSGSVAPSSSPSQSLCPVDTPSTPSTAVISGTSTTFFSSSRSFPTACLSSPPSSATISSSSPAETPLSGPQSDSAFTPSASVPTDLGPPSDVPTSAFSTRTVSAPPRVSEVAHTPLRGSHAASATRTATKTGDVLLAGSARPTQTQDSFDQDASTSSTAPGDEDQSISSSARPTGVRASTSGSVQSLPAMAAAPALDTLSLPPGTQRSTSTWESTMATASGTFTAGQVIPVTGVSAINTGPSAPVPTDGADAAAASGSNHVLLAAILVPVFVVIFVLLPCLWLLLRIRKRRKPHFMATYEDMTEGIPPYRYSFRTPYAETLSTINESDSPYDAAPIPSARRAHAEMIASRAARSDSEGVSNPFADPSEDDEGPHSPLFRGFPRWYGRARRGTGAASPASESSASVIVPVAGAPSRWGALSPSSVSSRSTSRLGNFSPVPAETSSGSRGTPAERPRSRFGLESASASGQECSTDAGSGSEWERISEDPFADPNKRRSNMPVPRVGASGGLGGSRKGKVVYSSLLPKVPRIEK